MEALQKLVVEWKFFKQELLKASLKDKMVYTPSIEDFLDYLADQEPEWFKNEETL